MTEESSYLDALTSEQMLAHFPEGTKYRMFGKYERRIGKKRPSLLTHSVPVVEVHDENGYIGQATLLTIAYMVMTGHAEII